MTRVHAAGSTAPEIVGQSIAAIGWLRLDDEAAFIGEPETNGCAERLTLPHVCRSSVPIGRAGGRSPG